MDPLLWLIKRSRKVLQICFKENWNNEKMTKDEAITELHTHIQLPWWLNTKFDINREFRHLSGLFSPLLESISFCETFCTPDLVSSFKYWRLDLLQDHYTAVLQILVTSLRESNHFCSWNPHHFEKHPGSETLCQPPNTDLAYY